MHSPGQSETASIQSKHTETLCTINIPCNGPQFQTYQKQLNNVKHTETETAFLHMIFRIVFRKIWGHHAEGQENTRTFPWNSKRTGLGDSAINGDQFAV